LIATNGEGCLADCPDAGGDWFGWSVAIKGKTLPVGAPFATAPSPPSATGPEPDGGTPDAPSTGTAYVFTGSRAAWTQKDELYDPAEVTAGVQDYFGSNVAVLGKSSIVATAPFDPGGYANYYTTGAAYVFPGHRGTGATYPTELTAFNGAANLWFGYGLATIGSKYVVVGDPYSGGTTEGVYIFKK